jgi:hypothetical protein
MSVIPVRTYVGKGITPVMVPEKAKSDAKVFAPGTYVRGQVLGGTSNLTTQNDVKTITVSGTPTGGTFVLQFAGVNTAPIAYNAAAAAVQTAFEAIVGAGNVVASGGAFPGATVVLTFQGTLAGRELPSITLYANSLTGGAAPTAAVANTTPGRVAGGHMKPYAAGNADGSQVAVCINQYDGIVDIYGNHTNFGGGDQGDSQQKTAPVWMAGYFLTKELVGLDAAAVPQLGRIVSGAIGSLSADATVLEVV